MSATMSSSFSNVYNFFLVGIKGTGMCALAELLLKRGKNIRGSDVRETFYTDAILHSLNITVLDFNKENITNDLDIVVYSPAYQPEQHPELLAAKQIGITLMSYPEALGVFSRLQPSFGISGVHGKTTTTAIAGTLVKAMRMPATVLAGSAVKTFDNRSTLEVGKDFFIAETCEYRRSFLNFSPQGIVVTSIEPDHQDCFPDFDAIFQAFWAYVRKLPNKGFLIFCSDDPGASRLALAFHTERPDIRLVPYGFSAAGAFKILPGAAPGSFSLPVFPGQLFRIKIPGKHIISDAVAAVALCINILQYNSETPLSSIVSGQIAQALLDFDGSRRRSEIIGSADNILFMDDYAHHPTAIRLTLAGLKEFHPGRRLVVDFMAHTYSRTEALLEEFSTAFSDADMLVVHDIYPSAREKPAEHWKVTGTSLFEAIKNNHPNVTYIEKTEDAFAWLDQKLQPGDVFITMGAGNNWELSHSLYKKKHQETQQ